MLKHYYLLIFLCSLILSACGGSSGSDSSRKNGHIDETDTHNEPNTPEHTSVINGTINPAANMQFDSDLNDINTPFIDNSSFSTAQTLQNFITLQGFVNEKPTNYFNSAYSDRSSDRFYSTTDTDDIFQVHLQQGQQIQLQVVNFEDSSNTDEIFSGDIDLHLYATNYDLISSSNSDSEFEHVQVPSDGVYYLNVSAWSGASKYILQILPANAQTKTASIENTMNFEPNQVIVQYKDTPALQRRSTSMQTLHRGISRPTLAIINHANSFNLNTRARTSSNELASLNHLSYQKLLTLKKLKTLRQQSNVVKVSLNYIRESQKVPSDTFYEYQWHYQSMNLPQAWDITTGTPNSGSVIVAVIDTGVYTQHPDLKNKHVPGFDFISDHENSGDNELGIDSNPEDPGDGQGPGSSSWHGTHVAGTIAAQTDNNEGIAGVSWGAKIMSLRALGKFGGTSYDIMQAMRFAAGLENDSRTLPNQRADIINLSLGSNGSSPMEAELYKQIHDMGIMIVAAAGNDNNSMPFYPAAYDGVISVSATDFRKDKAPYSNFGNHIDIAAPGGNNAANLNGDNQPDGVLSCLVDDTNGGKKAIYSFYQGTSMAAPHVSGMLALMKAIHPSLDANTVDGLLANGALSDDIGVSGRDDIYGYGHANALKAVQAALSIENGGILPPSPPILLALPSSLSFAQTAQATITVSNEGDGQPKLLSAFSNYSWLTVSPTEIDSEGLGRYQISVNDFNLSDGFYLGSVIFTFDNAPSLSVKVSLNVGNLETTGKLANLYTLLYDIEHDEVIQSARGINNSSDAIQFRFTKVPKGRYEIISGTDVDNDGFICQLGEACATYPPSSQIDPIDTTDLDTINVDMTAIILSSLNTHIEQTAHKPVQIAIKQPAKQVAQ